MEECPYCGEPIRGPLEKLAHMVFCPFAFPWTCFVCGKRFRSEKELMEHIRAHHPEVAEAIRKLAHAAHEAEEVVGEKIVRLFGR